MRNILITTPIGLGDLIYLKGSLDPIKDQFSEIRINFHRDIIQWFKKNDDYNKFLDEIGNLFFSELPYVLDSGNYPFRPSPETYANYKIIPQKPALSHLLCKGQPLDVEEEYIVLTTKIRYLSREGFNGPQLWDIIRQLSQKHKIVVLGEKQVEMNGEYLIDTSRYVYSIYPDIIANVPADRLIDLTISSLGITSPVLSQIQQDCLIMNKAKFIITLGIGGNFCMASAVGNIIGFRIDNEPIANIIYDGKTYPNCFISREWNPFIQALQMHL